MVTARDLLREPPEGAMPPDSPLYVERDFDEIAVQRIRQSDVTLMIKGPRQVGKSSLLQRLMKSAQDVQKRVVFLDFQRFDDSAMSTADDFFRQFFVLLTDLLGQPLDQVQHYWSLPLGNRMRGTRYMEQLLRTSPSSIVLAMDEVDRLLHIPFRTDFFGMIRSWHNERANVGSIWRRLDLVMIISTDPHLLIPNATESPFNVAESIRVLDFSQKEVEQLNFLYRSPFSQSQVEDLYTLLNGHPYLVRRALYSVICRFTDVPALFEQAGTDHGVFTDHLQTYLYRLYGNQRLINSLLEVIQHHSCTDQEMFFRLRGAGLIREENQQVLPRCRLYAEYFKRHLLPE